MYIFNLQPWLSTSLVDWIWPWLLFLNHPIHLDLLRSNRTCRQLRQPFHRTEFEFLFPSHLHILRINELFGWNRDSLACRSPSNYQSFRKLYPKTVLSTFWLYHLIKQCTLHLRSWPYSCCLAGSPYQEHLSSSNSLETSWTKSNSMTLESPFCSWIVGIGPSYKSCTRWRCHEWGQWTSTWFYLI